jgi:hypothetical protein
VSLLLCTLHRPDWLTRCCTPGGSLASLQAARLLRARSFDSEGSRGASLGQVRRAHHANCRAPQRQAQDRQRRCWRSCRAINAHRLRGEVPRKRQWRDGHSDQQRKSRSLPWTCSCHIILYCGSNWARRRGGATEEAQAPRRNAQSRWQPQELWRLRHTVDANVATRPRRPQPALQCLWREMEGWSTCGESGAVSPSHLCADASVPTGTGRASAAEVR